MQDPNIAIFFSFLFEGVHYPQVGRRFFPVTGESYLGWKHACNTGGVRTAVFVIVAAVSLTACSSREAGREAYKATQETKKAAKAAGRERKHAAGEAEDGWNES